jgi:hypothetical protein
MLGTPGSGEGPNGADLGADITKIAGANDVHTENK